MSYIAFLLKKAMINIIIPPIRFVQLLTTPVTTLTSIVIPSVFCENSLHRGMQAPPQAGRNCSGQVLLAYVPQSVKTDVMFCNCAHWLLHESFLSISHSFVDGGVSIGLAHERYVALQKNAGARLAQF